MTSFRNTALCGTISAPSTSPAPSTEHQAQGTKTAPSTKHKAPSTNAVGYLDNSITGYKMATPTFGNIGTEKYPIDNFVVKGSANGQTIIQVLDEEGQIDGTYYWYNAEGIYPAGWFDVNGLVPAGVELSAGDAVFFHAMQSGVTTETSGEVLGEKTTDIVGYKMVGNCSPVTIDIDQLTVQGSANGQTIIQVLDEEGQIDGTYYWYNAEGIYPAGWFDVNGLVPAGIQLKPGDAVFFHAMQSGVTATIPAAIPAAE